MGDIKGETEVAVRPKTIGRVEEIYVKEGDTVRAGQKLLSFVAGITRKDELYEDRVTFARISGVVGMQNIRMGEQVQIQNGSPAPVFTIYKINKVKIYVNVPEKYFSMVTRKTPVEIRLDAYPGKIFHGKVNNVRPVIDPYTRTTQVEIIINNPSHEIKPGMFSTVDLILKEKQNAMIIPFDSVLGLDEKSVFVDDDGIGRKNDQFFRKQEALHGLHIRDNIPGGHVQPREPAAGFLPENGHPDADNNDPVSRSQRGRH